MRGGQIHQQIDEGVSKLARGEKRWTLPLPVGLVGLMCSLGMISPPCALADPALDLKGSWYVLIHYRDDGTNNPDSDRWEDKIWSFEDKGSRLSWSEYPIVVFSDSQGRFERTMSGMTSRVLTAWEPNERQRREIERGLEASSRGSRSKTLRGSPAKGYKSAGSLRTQSVSVIGYHETWSIEGLSDLPVFTRDDLMGSGRTSKMEGRTQYRATEVLEGASLIRGSYERDGTRHGVFRMMRTGEPTKRRRDKKADRKRPYLTVFGLAKDKREIAEIVERAAQSGAPDDAARALLSERLYESVGRTLSDFGLKGPALTYRTESLSAQVESLLLEQAKSVEEIDEMVREGTIQP